MQKAVPPFTKTDLAKYPFLRETTQYVKKLDFRIEDITSPELAQVLERAEERLQEAILYNFVTRRPRNPDIEILSFPVATMLTITTENSFIKKRYALAEANAAYEDLREEPKDRILKIAQNFGWQIAANNSTPALPYDYALGFMDYLRNTTHLRDKNWKLVNRPLSKGNVYLGKDEIARLLKEEVQKQIDKRLEVEELPKFPAKITQIAEKMKTLAVEEIGKPEMEGFPKIVQQEAFPPCIQSLYQAFTSGRHLSHIGRFALTTFLINIGMPTQTLIDLFRNFSDFNERMTRYQVEHLAGEKGSHTRYTPPKCETLQTHGVCINPDDLCRRIYHPLNYYRRKYKNKPAEQPAKPT